jgi:rare lipoprotein A
MIPRILLIVIVFSLYACAGPRHSEISSPGSTERGIASWYGPGFHGKPTSSGEIYDMHQLTAAHRTLPLGTLVRVINLENGLQTKVRVNDRGPFIRGRIIDLSYAGAKELGMLEAGTVPVRIEILKAAVETGAPYTVQVGAFSEQARAHQLREVLLNDYQDVIVIPFTKDDRTYYRVRVGSSPNRIEIQKVARRLEREGYPTFITRKD